MQGMQGMIGVIFNTLTVLVGSSVGLLLKKGIPQKVSSAVMIALGLCTVYIGVEGALKGKNTIVVIVAMVIGTIIGTLLDIDGKIEGVGKFIEKRMKRKDDKTSVAQGFMTASLLFCVGAMTIVGSLKAGLEGDNQLIFTKGTLDLISSCMLASSMGIGVTFAAIFVFVFQGALVLLSGLLKNVLTEPIIAEITCAGSLMILGLGLNLIGIAKIKVANFLPALLFVPPVYYLVERLPIFS